MSGYMKAMAAYKGFTTDRMELIVYELGSANPTERIPLDLQEAIRLAETLNEWIYGRARHISKK